MTLRRSFLKTLVTSSVAIPAVASAGLCEKINKWDKTCDIIIVGAGGAGLTAAIVAKELGAEPVLLEKMSFVGGNTTISGGSLNAAVKSDYEAAGVEDSPELHAKQTIAAGDFRADPKLVRILTEGAPESVQWLKEHGVRFAPGIFQVYGGLWPRARNPLGQKGFEYTNALQSYAKKISIPIYTNHKVIEFIREEPRAGRIIGVAVETKDGVQHWKANKGIVVTAGGYAANGKLCGLYDPRLANLNTSNLPCSTGEVLSALQDIGVMTTGLDFIQCIPGTAKGYKGSGNLTQKVEYAIYLNKNATRFVAEDARRDVICNALLNQPDQIAYQVADTDGFDAMNQFQGDRNRKALAEGYMWKADTLDELAVKAGLPVEQFKKSIAEFNEMVDTKQDSLGRKASMLTRKCVKAPFYCCPFSMVRHHTMGGARIDEYARVLDKNLSIIPGLYAAGEITGGIHGSNRVGGNAVADAFTYGRIAGTSAAKGM